MSVFVKFDHKLVYCFNIYLGKLYIFEDFKMRVIGNYVIGICYNGAINKLVVVGILGNEFEMILWAEKHTKLAIQNCPKNTICDKRTCHPRKQFFVFANNLIAYAQKIFAFPKCSPYDIVMLCRDII